MKMKMKMKMNMYQLTLFISCALFSLVIRGEILRFEVLNSQKHPSTLEEACSTSREGESSNRKGKNILTSLIDIVDINQLDCMGTPLKVQEYCQRKMENDPAFMRGFVDLKEKKVICQTGDRVILQMNCDRPSPSVHCQQAKDDCLVLKGLLARNLKLHHTSITDLPQALPPQNGTGSKKVLNCHFVKKDFFQGFSEDQDTPTSLLKELF